jgi:hypothetical protein
VQVREYPPPPAVPGGGSTGTVPEQPTAPPPVPSPHPRLGRLVLSAAAVALGVLALVDLAGAAVPGSAYLAVPLAVVGVGLVVGGWRGRARWLIALGAVLTVVLILATAAEKVSTTEQSVTWRPTALAQLDRTYTIGVGNAVLDLSAVDFTGTSQAVDVDVRIGNLTIIVPPTVDVRANVQVNVGNATVFGTSWSGIGQSERTVSDDGTDGPGGGALVVRAAVDVGDVEVRR